MLVLGIYLRDFGQHETKLCSLDKGNLIPINQEFSHKWTKNTHRAGEVEGQFSKCKANKC
jgi:hypothetical protein